MTNAPSLKQSFNRAAMLDGGGRVFLRGIDEYEPRLLRIAGILRKSPTGRRLLDAAEQNGTAIALEWLICDRTNSLGICSEIYNTVALNPRASDEALVTTLAHELVHAVQHHSGLHTTIDKALPHSMLSLVQTTLAMEADAFSVIPQVAWELKDQHPAFAAMIENPNDMMAATFRTCIAGDPAAATDGRARIAAFLGFYFSHGLRSEYEKTSLESIASSHEKGIYDPLLFQQDADLAMTMTKLDVLQQHPIMAFGLPHILPPASTISKPSADLIQKVDVPARASLGLPPRIISVWPSEPEEPLSIPARVYALAQAISASVRKKADRALFFLTEGPFTLYDNFMKVWKTEGGPPGDIPPPAPDFP